MLTHEARSDVHLSPLAIRALLAGAFALLLALSGQEWLQFYLPGFPRVPVTLQTAVVVTAAITLGTRWGVVSVVLFLLAGVLGAPVFADNSAGAHVLVGVTGGYLVGFLFAQPAINALLNTAERPSAVRLVVASLVGHAVIFGIGVPWLMIVAGLDVPTGLKEGLLVFLPGMVVKTAAAATVGCFVMPWRRRLDGSG